MGFGFNVVVPVVAACVIGLVVVADVDTISGDFVVVVIIVIVVMVVVVEVVEVFVVVVVEVVVVVVVVVVKVVVVVVVEIVVVVEKFGFTLTMFPNTSIVTRESIIGKIKSFHRLRRNLGSLEENIVYIK